MRKPVCVFNRRSVVLYLVALPLLSAICTTASAAVVTTWLSPAPDNWFTPTNWNMGLPTAADTAIVGNGGTAQVGAGAAQASVLDVGAGTDDARSGNVTVTGGSLTAPTVRVGTATTTDAGLSATGTGTLQMSDAALSAATLMQVGVCNADNGNSLASTGSAALSGGTATVGELQVGVANLREANANVRASLLFERLTFTGTGAWTVGAANKTGMGGTAAVDQAQATIHGGSASTADLTGLNVGWASASYGTAGANAALSFSGRQVTTANLWIGTASASSGGSANSKASATIDADLFVTGNASVGMASASGSESSQAGIFYGTGLTVEPGHRFSVGGDLTVGSGSAGSQGAVSINSPFVSLGQGVDFSVGGLLTLGQASTSGDRSVSVDESRLTLEGGTASLGGGLVVGRATAGRSGPVRASGALSIGGETSIDAHGSWTIGQASVPSGYRGNATAVAEASLLGGATSVVDLISVIVGQASSAGSGSAETSGTLAFGGQEFVAGPVSVGAASTSSTGRAQVDAASVVIDADRIVTGAIDVGVCSADDGEVVSMAEATFSGGTAAVGELKVGIAGARETNAAVSAGLLFEGTTFTGTGAWTVGSANKSGDGGTATVNQADLTIRGDSASTADLTGLNVGSASARYGTAGTNAALSFSGRQITTGNLWVGTASADRGGSVQVHSASAEIDADLIVTADAVIGSASASGSYEGAGAGVGNTDLIVGPGHRFSVGGALTIGNAGANALGGTNVSNPTVTLGQGADLSVTGLLAIGQASARYDSNASVGNARLIMEDGTASLSGGLLVGSASTDRDSSNATVSAGLQFGEQANAAGQGVWTIGKASVPAGADGAATVSSADVAMLGQSSASLTSMIVGHAWSEGPGTGRATASLTFCNGSFSSTGTGIRDMAIGVAEGLPGCGVIQATGSASFVNAQVDVPWLHVGLYIGGPSQNPASFAHGELSLVDSTMTVQNGVTLARLYDWAGAATGKISLRRSLMDVDGDLLLRDGSALWFDIDGVLRGDEYGAMDVRAALLSGDLTVMFRYMPSTVGQWDLITLDPGGNFEGGLDFDTKQVLGLPETAVYTLGFATNSLGQNVYRLDLSEVPEPATMGLLGLGLLGLIRRRRT